MDESFRAAQSGEAQPSAPILPQKPPFSASKTEKIAALCAYPIAFCYAVALTDSYHPMLWMLAFALGFFALGAYLFRAVPRSKASVLWLFCTLTVLVCLAVQGETNFSFLKVDGHPEHAVPFFLSLLILHVFAIVWAVERSGRLQLNRNGWLAPLDAANALLLVPFGNFFLRIRCALCRAPREAEPAKKGRARAAVCVPVILAAAVLLAVAIGSLSSADDAFAALFSSLRSVFSIHFEGWTFLLRLMLSLPVGAYVFGLLAGLNRKAPAELLAQGARAEARLSRLHQLPDGVCLAILGVFTAVYLVFFAVQGRYLFGAFAGTLPAGFSAAAYARQGFFELCRVMAVNFALFFLITACRQVPSGRKKALGVMLLVLLAQSLLFAAVALSKLTLYISIYGFTPKRLQSMWMIFALSLGCVLAGRTLLFRRRGFSLWLKICALTLALLHLV